jgi:hypothetical protein
MYYTDSSDEDEYPDFNEEWGFEEEIDREDNNDFNQEALNSVVVEAEAAEASNFQSDSPILLPPGSFEIDFQEYERVSDCEDSNDSAISDIPVSSSPLTTTEPQQPKNNGNAINVSAASYSSTFSFPFQNANPYLAPGFGVHPTPYSVTNPVYPNLKQFPVAPDFQAYNCQAATMIQRQAEALQRLNLSQNMYSAFANGENKSNNVGKDCSYASSNVLNEKSSLSDAQSNAPSPQEPLYINTRQLSQIFHDLNGYPELQKKIASYLNKKLVCLSEAADKPQLLLQTDDSKYASVIFTLGFSEATYKALQHKVIAAASIGDLAAIKSYEKEIEKLKKQNFNYDSQCASKIDVTKLKKIVDALTYYPDIQILVTSYFGTSNSHTIQAKNEEKTNDATVSTPTTSCGTSFEAQKNDKSSVSKPNSGGLDPRAYSMYPTVQELNALKRNSADKKVKNTGKECSRIVDNKFLDKNDKSSKPYSGGLDPRAYSMYPTVQELNALKRDSADKKVKSAEKYCSRVVGNTSILLFNITLKLIF